jgi:hypothetical protein
LQILRNAEYLPELCFRDVIEYRLYLELKRVVKVVNVKTDDNDLDNVKDNWFNIAGVIIRAEDKIIIIFHDDIINEINISEFLTKPRAITKIIIDMVRKILVKKFLLVINNLTKKDYD